MNVTIHSLGCRVNQYESAVLAQSVSDTAGDRNLHIVNTCTVTALAERKGRKLVRRLRREEPQALLVAVGCQATVSPEGLVRAGADLVVPNRDKSRLAQVISAHLFGRPWSAGSERGWPTLDEERLRGPVQRTRVPLKIQDGCTAECSYCLTRGARGPLRSKSPQAVVQEARGLAQAGHRELVLTGVNLGQYGRDGTADADLVSLLKQLATAVPDARLRLSSLGPEALTERLIALLARTPLICPHLHLPLQSGDDSVLLRMRRPYRVADYRERVRSFLSTVPGATFGTDIMVGFPGEDERSHVRTVRLCDELKPLNTHIFRFSPRPGTEAHRLGPAVPPPLARARAEDLARRAKRWFLAARAAFLGAQVHVLPERLHRGTAWGHSENYLYVGFPTRSQKRGTITPVRVGYVDPTCVMGVTEDQRDV